MTTVPEIRAQLFAAPSDKQGEHIVAPKFTRFEPMQTSAPKALLLQTTTPLPIPNLLPRLKTDLRFSDVWIKSTNEISSRAADLHLELHHDTVQMLYTIFIRCGLQLNRAAQIALSTLCSRQYTSPVGVIDIRLEIRFLAPARLTHPGQIVTIPA